MKKMILIVCTVTGFLQAQNSLEGRPHSAPVKAPKKEPSRLWKAFSEKVHGRPSSAPVKTTKKEPSQRFLRKITRAHSVRRRRSSIVPLEVFEREKAEQERKAKDKAKKKRPPSESGDERESVSPGAVLVRVKPKRGQSISVSVAVGEDGKAEVEKKERDPAALLGSAGGKLETAETAAEESEESDCGAKCCGCFKGLLALICIL